jgi:LCP family protein required for cell wall assembly
MAETVDQRTTPEDAPSQRPPARPGRGRRVFLVTAGVLSLLIAGGSAFSVQAIHSFNAQLTHIQSSYTTSGNDPRCDPSTCLSLYDAPKCFTRVCNYLVLGSDSRAGLSAAQQSQFGSTSDGETSRSDTIMFVHLNIPDNKSTIVSIPRDLYVYIPGHGYDKINAAFSYGPGVLVKTIEHLTGMHVNHYVAVNFAGFENLVDVIGGVPVCVDKPMIDGLAGLNLPHAGCYNLMNKQALGFVRARHIEGDLIPDFSRIARQQIFFRAMLNKLMSAGSVVHLPALLHAVKNNVVIDQKLDLFALQDLMQRIDVMGQEGVDFRAVPAVPFVQNGIDYVRALQPETQEIFSRIKNDQRLYQLGKVLPSTGMSPANVRVQVLDMNSGGRAQKIADYLARAGFFLLKIRPAAPNLKHDQVRWAPDMHNQRKTLMQYLHGIRAVQGETFGPGGAIVVVVGPDFPPQQ